MVNDLRRQLHQHRCQDVRRDDIIFLITGKILRLLIIDQVADDRLHLILGDVICLKILPDRVHRAGIQVCSVYMPRAEHDRYDSQNAASCSDVQNFAALRHVFLQLSHAQLRGFMHAGPECGARIDVKDLLAPVLFLHLFPGGDDQYVIYRKLVKILFPVIDPVLVLRLRALYGAGADVGELPQGGKFLFHSGKNSIRVLVFVQIEAEVGCPVIGSCRQRDIHEHLLQVFLRQGNIILDLGAFHACVCQRADHYVFSLCCRLQPELRPLHELPP